MTQTQKDLLMRELLPIACDPNVTANALKLVTTRAIELIGQLDAMVEHQPTANEAVAAAIKLQLLNE